MKPPPSHQISLSHVTSVWQVEWSLSKLVIFKTQGEFLNMSKLVQETWLKPDLIKNIVSPLLNEINDELSSELKSDIKTI